MEPLATATQLASRLQSTLDSAAADLALANASGLIRAVARQTFTFVSQEIVDLTGGSRVLTLPQRPAVVNETNPLTVVELGDYGGIDLPAVEGQHYTRVGNELTRGYPYRYNSRLQGWPYRQPLGVWTPRVRVTYSHGYLVMPDEIVAVTLDVAQSLYSNPQGLRSFTTPEYSETYATELLGAATVESIKARLGMLGHGQRAFTIQST